MSAEPHRWLGSIDAAAHGGDAPGLLDLSASLAPCGPSPYAVAAARHAAIGAYPPRDAAPLVAAMAAELGVATTRLAPGAGAADLLLRAALSHLGPGDAAVVVGPCFGEYERAVRAAGARSIRWDCDPTRGFALDVDAVARAASQARARLGFLARPANPTGVDCGTGAVAALVARTPATTWVLDEAFVGLTEAPQSTAGSDAITVRSLTKELALPGLRVAIADAPPHVAAAMRALAPPWPVSAPALAAAVAGLADHPHRQRARRLGAAGRTMLGERLERLGARLSPSATTFVCAELPRPHRVAARMRERGVAVRLCDDLGLPGWLRIAVPPPERLDEVLSLLDLALEPAVR